MLSTKEIHADIRWHEGMIKALEVMPCRHCGAHTKYTCCTNALIVPEDVAWEQGLLTHHRSWVTRLTDMLGGQ